MKVGIAQINTVAGDFPGNARRLLHAYRECLDQDADWVLSPGLGLAGGEIASREIGRCLQALDYLGSETRATPLVVGHPSETGTDAASLLVDGIVRATFTEPAVIDWRGHRVAIMPGHGIVPQSDLVLQLVREAGETVFRAAEGTPHIRCNAIGGDREWIYPGRSVVCSSSGRIIVRLASFAEECRVVDVTAKAEVRPDMDRAGDLFAGWALGFADFVNKHRYLGVSLLLDGRPESLLLARLAKRILGDEAVEVVTLFPEHSMEGFSAGVLDASGITAAVSATLGGPADRHELAAFILSTVAHRSGYLPLIAATRIDLLGGDFGFVDGLAPFGCLNQGDLLDLANAAGLAFVPDFSSESIVSAISDEGAALEELLRRGYPEMEVLRWQRRIDQARFRVRPPVLRLRPLNG